MKQNKLKNTRLIMKHIPALLLAVLIFPALPLYAEEARLAGEDVLKLVLTPSYNFASQRWGNSGKQESGKLQYFNIGMDIEYGVASWISALAGWTPGANAWSKMDDDSKAGYFSDVFLGTKLGIIGREALIENEDMRFSAAVGIHDPLPSGKNSTYVTDTHRWGAGLRLYYDDMFNPSIFVNVYTEVLYNPEQKSDNPNYKEERVKHPFDFAFEIEPQGNHPVGPGISLHWGLPLRYTMSPASKLRGNSAMEKDEKHNFSVGSAFGVFFSDLAAPFELRVHYLIPVAGRNDAVLTRVGLSGRIFFNF
jgi:hypothetical protein